MHPPPSSTYLHHFHFVLVLLSTLLIQGVSGDLPRVRWEPGDGVVEGGTVQLECQLGHDVMGPAIWLKLDPKDPNSHTLISHGDLLIIEDNKFSVRRLPETNAYVVTIENVSAEDAGSYQCQVQVSLDHEDHLRVQAAPPVVVTLLQKPSSGGPSPLPSATLIASLLLLLLTALKTWPGVQEVTRR
ncbi:lachesin-like [Oratosquilla oratoria]|uniref:lachesin-like n=1 Tax=Oratosquilla oratoria TaxID=337810 RepID=UPI003F76091E